MSKHSLKRNFVYNTIYQIVQIITPLVTVPYLSRILGAANIGTYSYTYAIANYFILFAMLGMSTYGVRAVSIARAQSDDVSKTFWDLWFCQLLSCCVIVVLYFIYMLLFPQGSFIYTALWLPWIVSACLDISWFMFGMEQFKVTSIRSIIVLVIELISIFAFVRTQDDLAVYIGITSFGYLAMQLTLWPFLKSFVCLDKPSWDSVVEHFRNSFRLFLPIAAASLYTQLDKIMLGGLSDMAEVGYYDYAGKLAKFPLAVLTAFGVVMLPRMSSEISEGHSEKALELIDMSIWGMLFGAIAITAGMVAIAPEFVPVFFGDGFLPCISLMRVFAFRIPLVAASNVLGKQYLLPCCRDKEFTQSVCLGAVVNIVVNLALIPSLGAQGAVIGSVLAEIAVLAWQCRILRCELPLQEYFIRMIPFAIIGVIMILIVRLTSCYLSSLFGLSAFTLIVEIIVGCLVYALLSLLFCEIKRDSSYLALKARLIHEK